MVNAGKKPPSLLDPSVRTAIDNLRHLTSVDGMDTQLLRQILPHCTLDQLIRIESHTQTDLTPVTDVLWKGFYERQFGEEHTGHVLRRMRQSGARFRWKELFMAKTKKQKEIVDQMVEALASKCRARNAEKQSKRTKLVTVLPTPSCGKRKGCFGFGPGGGGVSGSSYKSPMMKKARMEVDSRARMQAAAVRRRPASHGQQMRTTTDVNRPSPSTRPRI
uniref:Uncharacterized protein n=1 Tax=Avena sativa TaxID=4498 RepID=A0ACD5TG33_AVESA